METREQQKNKEFNKTHRIRIKTLFVVTITKKISLPRSAFFDNQDLLTERMRLGFPKSYQDYFKAAKKRHPKIYNGNYARTTNTFSVGSTTEDAW